MGLNTEDQDYATAFDESAALDSGSVTEDMASPGMDLEEAAEADDAVPADAAPEVESPAPDDGQLPAPADEAVPPGDELPEDSPSIESSTPSGEVDLEKERQRLKSWEGRLKAREAELRAKEEQAPADSGDDPAQAVQEAAAMVSADKPIDQVLARLAEDFGQDFVDALSTLVDARAADIADKVAGEKVGAVSSTVEGIIAGLTDERARAHFEAIADAHPDFMQVHDSAEFKDWVESLGEKAEEAKAVVEHGSARAINKLLSEFKAAKAGSGSDEFDDAALSAAQGVKGRTGLRLPAKPAASDDYEAAWNEA